MKTRVLIIEDAKFMALSFKAALQGYDVQCIAGIASFEPLIGIGFEKEAVQIDASEVAFALVDGQLLGEIEGPAIVEKLAALGITCVGVSSQNDYNQKMRDNGARLACNKAAALGALWTRLVTPENARTASRKLAQTLEHFERNFLKMDGLKKELDELIMSFLKE